MARMPSVPKSLRVDSFMISILDFSGAGLLVGGGGFDATGKGAVGEAGGELIARCELGGRSDEAALGGEDEGVAAVEDGEGRERVEAGVESADTDGGALQGAFERTIEAGAKGEEAFAGLGKRLAGIVAKDGGGAAGNLVLQPAKLSGEG